VPLIGRRIRKQNDYMLNFAAAGAVASDSAKTLREVGAGDSRVFRQLVRRGVIVEDQPGRFHLDVPAGLAFRRRRRQQALAVLAIAGGVAIVAILVTLLLR
jgi:hypothetical protein